MKRLLPALLALSPTGCADAPPDTPVPSVTGCDALVDRLRVPTPPANRVLALGSNFVAGTAQRINLADGSAERLDLGVTGDTIGRTLGDALALLHRAPGQGDNITLFDLRAPSPRLVCQLTLVAESERRAGLQPYANAHDVLALDGRTLLVARYAMNSLAVLDIARGTVLRTVDLTPFLGRATQAHPEALLRVGSEVWVSLQRLDRYPRATQPGLIVRLDAEARAVRSTVTLRYSNPVGPMLRAPDGRVLVATVGSYDRLDDGGLEAITPTGSIVNLLYEESTLGANLDGFGVFADGSLALKLASARSDGAEAAVRVRLERAGGATTTLLQRDLWSPTAPAVLGDVLVVGDPGTGAGMTGAGVRRFGLDGLERGNAVSVGVGMRPYDLVPVP